MNFTIEKYDSISIREFLLEVLKDIQQNNPDLTIISLFVNHKEKELISLTSNANTALAMMAHSIADILIEGIRPDSQARKQIDRVIKNYTKMEC